MRLLATAFGVSIDGEGRLFLDSQQSLGMSDLRGRRGLKGMGEYVL